ncbi:SIMPL domain-containing protein [Phormidesmis sp. 146-35]
MISSLKPSHSTWSRFKALPILGLISFTLASPAIAQEKLMRTLTVTGRGFEEIPTTLTQVRLGVEFQGKTAGEAQQSVARRSTSVVTLLKSRSVDKLETTGISLNPVYRYDNNTQTLVGYTATNSVSFRLPTEKAGTILDDAVSAGATRIEGVSFIATDDAIAAAQKQALRKATQDAQGQADSVLNALNFTRKEIVSIQVNGAFAPPPRPAEYGDFAARVSASKAPSPVIGGDQRVEGSVTLQISY